MKTPSSCFAVLLILGVLALSPQVHAQWSVGNYGRVPDTGMAAGRQVPQDKILSSVHWEQKLQNQLPLDASFKDESGKDVQFGQYFNGKRPVVLAMIFYNCTMLCSQVLNDMMKGLHGTNMVPGKDCDVVIVSINPKEGPQLAKGKKKSYLDEYKFSQNADGFHFLTGSKENIDKVTDAAGYFYKYDPKTEQYAHPGGIVIATPTGKIARYFTGLMYEPRDMRLSMVEASQGKVGTMRDLILLRCFHYDDTTGKYSLAIMEVLRAVAAGFVIIVGLSLALWVRRDLKKEKLGTAARIGSTPSPQPPTPSL